MLKYIWLINGKVTGEKDSPCLLTIFVFYQDIWLKQGDIAGNEYPSEEK